MGDANSGKAGKAEGESQTDTLPMKTMLQIRNVPSSTHRRLKARAALEGVSMSHFLLREIERALQRPSRNEVLDAIGAQSGMTLDPPPAEIIRQERELQG